MRDIKLNIIDRKGELHEIVVPDDMNLSLMEVCRANDLEVEGTCGGMALCASCQVYIESDHHLHEPTDDELEMLDQAFFVTEKSRLGCQIKIDETVDGLTVRIAPKHD
ncbi:MAG: 2Fe-2S iron-sulfur cluster-binding protein [Chitinophagales bacterium]